METKEIKLEGTMQAPPQERPLSRVSTLLLLLTESVLRKMPDKRLSRGSTGYSEDSFGSHCVLQNVAENVGLNRWHQLSDSDPHGSDLVHFNDSTLAVLTGNGVVIKHNSEETARERFNRVFSAVQAELEARDYLPREEGGFY